MQIWKLLLLLAVLFLNGCSLLVKEVLQEVPINHKETPSPAISPAEDFFKKCDEEINKLEKSISQTTDLYEKAVLCKMAADKAMMCFEKGLRDFPNSPDLPPLGIDYYHETTNYLCYCKNIIADKEIDLNSEQDPIRRYNLLKEKIDFSMECLVEFTSDFYDPSLVPGLGVDALGESSNVIKNCKKIIDDLKKQINESKGEAREELIEKMMKIEIGCMHWWLSDFFAPELVPDFGKDPYKTKDYYRIPNNDPSVLDDEDGDSTPIPPDQNPTPETNKTDTCPDVTVYGYPVYDPNNLPTGCKPTDSRPGWDCYTFEKPECDPSLRCFCLTPPEQMPGS